MNKTHEQIQQAQNNILKSTIDLVTEKELWKKRTFKLAQHNKQCYLCLSKESWNPTSLTCQECFQFIQKEVHHA